MPLHLILGAFDKPARAARRASAARTMLVIGYVTTAMTLATSGFLIVSVWPALHSGGDFLVLVVAPATPVLGTATLITRSRKRLRAANPAPGGDARP